MNDFDPLHPAAYDPQLQQQRVQSSDDADGDLSSVARRSPLPGLGRDYRPPGSSTDVRDLQDATRSGWTAAHAPAGQDDRASEAWGGGGAAGSAQRQVAGGSGGGMVARPAQTIDSPNGRRRQDSSDGPVRQAQGGPGDGQQREGFIRIRIMGIERNRRDTYIKFNAEVCQVLPRPQPFLLTAVSTQTNLPNFHHSACRLCRPSLLWVTLIPRFRADRAVSRSYGEFMQFLAALSVTCPQSIVPALPLAQTSAASDEEDDRLLKAAFQKWAIRVTSDPAVIRDDETRSFIESDFGVRDPARLRPCHCSHCSFPQYTARNRKRAAGSYFSRTSRLPGEQDDPLTSAKVSMARLETTFHDTAKTIDRVSKSRRATAGSVNELGGQLDAFAMAEAYAPLANGFKRLARTMKVDADLLAVQVRRLLLLRSRRSKAHI